MTPIAKIALREHCLTASRKSSKRAKHILGLIHADLCGLLEEEAIGKAKCFLTLTDDKTR